MFVVNFDQNDADDDRADESGESDAQHEGVATALSRRLRGGSDVGSRQRSYSTTNLYTDDEEPVGYVDDEENELANQRRRAIRRWTRMTLLVISWLVFMLLLFFNEEHEAQRTLLCVPASEPLDYELSDPKISEEIRVSLYGPFVPPNTDVEMDGVLSVVAQRVYDGSDPKKVVTLSTPWTVRLMDTSKLDQSKPLLKHGRLPLNDVPVSERMNSKIQLSFSSNIAEAVPMHMQYQPTPLPLKWGGVFSFVLIISLLLMIKLSLCNFALACMYMSTLAIAILACYNLRPTLPLLVGWIHIDMLLIVFSMTIITALFADSGLLDLAVYRAYQFTNGHIWPMLNCIIAATIISALLCGTLITVILLTPIVIRYCEALDLDPVPSLVMVILFTVFGSGLRPLDKALLKSYDHMQDPGWAAVTYGDLVAHITPGIILMVIHTYMHIRLRFIDSSKMGFSDLNRLQRVIRVWKHTAKQISGYSKDEQIVRDTVMVKVRRLRTRVRRLGKMPGPVPLFEQRLLQLKNAYNAHGRKFYYMCVVVLLLLLIVCSLHHAEHIIELTLGWITVLAFILLLTLFDVVEIDGILARIDWSSMFFLASMCILMEAMFHMGLYEWLANWMTDAIAQTAPNLRLLVALLLILWVSAIVSALLMEHSFLNFMLPVVVNMSEQNLGIPLQPMLWAFILGVTAGSAGTIIGAAANVVCAGVAEKHNYNMKSWYFFKIAMPIMLLNLVLLTIYLFVAHIVYEWH